MELATIAVNIPRNLIPLQCEAITPEMLPLVKLSTAEIECIVGGVPGGAKNVQDIYPLAPLQEGILFHHLRATRGDPCLLSSLYSFDRRARLDAYLVALQAAMARHDIFRTGVVWEGLREPAQVVWREAPMPVEEVQFDPAGGDVAGQLKRRFDLRHHRIDVRRAPLVHSYTAYDAANHRWLLLLLTHQLAGDLTILEVMQEELEAHLLGHADHLPEPLPFRNVVAQARLGVSQEEHERFFRKLLGDVDKPTAPFGLVNVHGDGSGIEEASLKVDGGLARRLQDRARKLGVGVASLCHLAWAHVLARVSGHDDVVFGTILFGHKKRSDGAERQLGSFVNTLPVRIRVGEEGVEASVRTTHSQLADLMRHEYASLALAQRCSAVPPSVPLFSALLNYRDSPNISQKPSTGTVRALEGIEELYSERRRTNYPLSLAVDDLGEGFTLTAQVSAEISPMRVCEFMRTALERLVEALERTPAKATRRLDVLPEAERRRVLDEWNDTKTEYPSDRCIHEMFEDQVERTPEAVAVVHESQKLTYRELNTRANRLAHHLRNLGVKPDERVAICVERGIEMVVGLLAVLKAGGAYVPLDRAYPVERLRYMLEDSAPTVLLTKGRFSELFAGHSQALRVVDLTTDSPEWVNKAESNPDVAGVGLTPRHLAYVMYTSGSTGIPKGVMVEHQGMQNLLQWYTKESNLSSRDVVLVVTSYSFDLTQRNIFAPLLVGGVVYLAKEPFDAQAIVTLVAGERITIMNLTPSAFYTLIDRSVKGEFGNVRAVILGGEAIDPSRLLKLAKPWPEFFNCYGPTECTGIVTFYHLSSDLARYMNRSVPLGRPMPNGRIYILDEHGDPVPIGVVGEIHIGGAGVARGYLNRPEMTAERFVRDPFAPEPEVRMYKTGDLGKWLPDGMIEFLGRKDFQVKVRGYRIEPGEIEAKLKEYPGVGEAVVLAREDSPGDKRLVAYYTRAGAVRAEELRSRLAERLPEYMVPAAYVRLEALPLTPNGKLDRMALPAPETDAYAVREYEALQGEIETILAKIWSDVLKVERVGRHDDFFELGGDSLLAVQAVILLKEAGIEIMEADLFTHSTIESLATVALRNAGRTNETSMNTAISIREEGGDRPLFFLPHAGPAGIVYASILTPYLDPDIPVFALPLDSNGSRESVGGSPLQTMQAMAERMTRMIRVVQPVGPYRVAGSSFGGILAYEVATQLIGKGQVVEFLGLFDSQYVAGTPHFVRRAKDDKGQLLDEIKWSAGSDEDLLTKCGEVESAATTMDFASLLRTCKDLSLLPRYLTRLTTTEVQYYLAGQYARYVAKIQYRAQPISIPIHLFAAQDPDTVYDVETADPLRGWGAVLPTDQIRVIPIAGTHRSMFDAPNLQRLGEVLSYAIRNATRWEAT